MARLSDEEIGKIAGVLADKWKVDLEFYVKQMAPSMVEQAVRRLLTSDPDTVHLIRTIVADQSREVLREWRAASPAGPVVSRDAIWKAVLAVQMDGKEKGFLGADDAALDRACESFRKSGYFVV